MSIKGIGALLIIAGCGGFGFAMASGVRQLEKLLRQLIRALDMMEAELQYRLTALPELCAMAAKECEGPLREIFRQLKIGLSRQDQPDAAACMDQVLDRYADLPVKLRRHLRHLGRTLGRFDLPGQLRGLQAIRAACEVDLKAMDRDRDSRLRSYQTLSVCAGAALVILFA